MEPRVYVYRTTFKEVPNFYHGWHLEKRFGEDYFGSPVSCKQYWELYTPCKEIIKVFENSDVGIRAALEFEEQLIREHWDNPLSLNRHCVIGFHPQVLRDLWKDPEHKRKRAEESRERMIAQWNNPDWVSNTVEKAKKQWEDPEYRKEKALQASVQIKEQWKDPEFRKRVSEARREQWEDPEALRIRSMQTKQQWESEEYREMMSKMMSGENNPNFGLMWITDGTREGSFRIPKDSEIPEGFRKGRVMKRSTEGDH
jgi:hypothetical protein